MYMYVYVVILYIINKIIFVYMFIYKEFLSVVVFLMFLVWVYDIGGFFLLGMIDLFWIKYWLIKEG